MAGAVTIRLVSNKLPAIVAALPREVNRICEDSAVAIAQDAMAAMGEPKTGRIYQIGNVDHQASAPGEAPAIDTGLLAAIQTEPDGSAWVTYTEAEYSVALEFGSTTQKILPRPFFTPATERERPKFLGALQDLEDRLR